MTMPLTPEAARTSLSVFDPHYHGAAKARDYHWMPVGRTRREERLQQPHTYILGVNDVAGFAVGEGTNNRRAAGKEQRLPLPSNAASIARTASRSFLKVSMSLLSEPTLAVLTIASTS
jgi:hypothetical protein